MPRATKEYTQAGGGLNESRTAETVAERRRIYSGSPASIRHASVQVRSTPGQQQTSKALQSAQAYATQKVISRLSNNWEPFSIPSMIRLNALESALRAPQQRELARVETFLFQRYLGKIRQRKDSRLNERTFRKIIDEQLSAGKWQIVKEDCRIKKGARWNNLSPVYKLSPEYMQEIAEQDIITGRYGALRAKEQRERYIPPIPQGMPLKVALWLNQGGIVWSPETMLSMLADPGRYATPSKGKRETWLSVLKGWKKLSAFTASRPLLPSWNAQNKVGWIYSSKPCIQGVPSVVRRNALKINGSPLAEPDYGSLQLNMFNHVRGVGIMDNPLAEILTILREVHRIKLSRSELKQALYPLFQGRSRFMFNKTAREDLFLDHEQTTALWSILEPFTEGNGLDLMRTQGKMIMKALELLQVSGADPVIPLFDALATRQPEEAKEALKQASRIILYPGCNPEELAEKDAIPVHVEYANQGSFAV